VKRLQSIQHLLQRFYALEAAPDVRNFVRDAGPDVRENLLVRERDGHLEIALVLPEVDGTTSVDHALQLVEGVSHFLLLVERSRTGLPTTRLELELQAEVDKFVVAATSSREMTHDRARRLHDRLYERVTYLHAANTEEGRRYRLANDLAARFLARVVTPRVVEQGLGSVRPLLRRFYRFGQTEKIRWAKAA
jgi:hypothetical protein